MFSANLHFFLCVLGKCNLGIAEAAGDIHSFLFACVALQSVSERGLGPS
jgi:hypothetical protein